MKRFQGTKGAIIIVLLLLLIIGYYYYLSNRTDTENTQAEATVTISPVQEVLLRDLEINYPATPKEVIKYYGQLNQVLYSEKYTDEEFAQLADYLYQLYDPELALNNEKTEYVENLKAEITSFHTNDWAITGYSTSASTDVDYFENDEGEFARLYCYFTLREVNQVSGSTEKFLLRKDEKGHWRIYGWELDKRGK